MISRFVLVGLVAALGISIPTRSELASCVTALHEWTATGLAALDASGHRPLRPVLLAWVPERQRPVYAPIEPATSVVGIADELNRMADGVEVPPPSAHPRRSGVPEPLVGQPNFIPADTMEEKLVVELRRIVAEVPSPETPISPTIEKRHDRPARGESQCLFSRGVLSIATVAPQWEPIEAPAEFSADIATTLNRFAEGMDHRPAPRRPLATVAEVKRVFEGLPFAGPSVANGQSIQAGPVRQASTRIEARPAQSPEVSRAVDLTGEALLAWIRVLRGSGDLRISSR